MTNKRTTIMDKILEQERLRKEAQEVEPASAEIDQATADKLAKEIFDTIFDEELKKLIG